MTRKNTIKKTLPPPPSPVSAKKTVSPAQSPVQQSSGGFLSNMIQGFSLGTGSAIGHRAVGAIFDSNKSPENNKCLTLEKELKNCMDCSNNDYGFCKDISDMLEKCKYQKN